jgi:hypothetical protein
MKIAFLLYFRPMKLMCFCGNGKRTHTSPNPVAAYAENVPGMPETLAGVRGQANTD